MNDEVQKSNNQNVTMLENSKFQIEPYIGIDEIASMYHIAKKTIQNWCSQSEINDLPYYKMGKVVLFRLSEFDLWFRISKGSKAAKKIAIDTLMSLTGKSNRLKIRFA